MDRRDFVSERGSVYRRLRLDEARTHALITLTDDEGEEEEVRVPVYFEVCDLCEGKGKHVNPSIDAHGLSREDFDEDPDFEEAYRSGHYDVECYECHGACVVPRIAEKGLDAKTKALVERVQKHLGEEDEFDRESAAEREQERRFGC